MSAGVVGTLESWQIYATIAAGILATWLLQNAYDAGRLTAAQPGVTLVDPIVSIIWGTLVFGGRVNGAPYLAAAIVPVLVLAGAVVVLSRSPALQGAQGTPDSQEVVAAASGAACN
ncbi:MAG: hypothetical protein ACLPUO_11665 [Streptosporangiaceae bacterium]|jgi:hypothetical protein